MELTRDELIALGIPVYHDPAQPCPDYPHFSEKIKGRLLFGCPRCDVGWSYEHLEDNLFNGLSFLQWLKDTGRKQPKGGGEITIEPLGELWG